MTALALGFAGMRVVMGLGVQFPWPRNVGDWLRLVSGVAWAYGCLQLYRMGSVAIPEQVLSFVAGGLLGTVVGLAFGGAALGGTPSGATLVAAAPFGLLAAHYMDFI